MAHPVVEADALPVVLARLRLDPALESALGGPGRIGGINEPPYPRLMLSYLQGDDRDTRWFTSPHIQVEAIGDLDGTPGSYLLRRILYTALAVMRDIPAEETPPGQMVITHVATGTSAAPSPLPNGQPRWVASRRLYVHPAPDGP